MFLNFSLSRDLCVLSFSCFLFCLLGFVVWLFGVSFVWLVFALFFLIFVFTQFVDTNFKITFATQFWWKCK